MERIETIIIGGGQAGLSTSYYLNQLGREHLILEQAHQAGNAWRNGRWDSFALLTPNWSIKLPGTVYRGDKPDDFMPRDELVAYFEKYIENFDLPVQYDTAVLVVGSAQSGTQIAEELYQSGRTVYLCVGTAPRVPRRYSGRDAFAWLVDTGFTDRG